MKHVDESLDMLFNLLPGAIRGADEIQPGHPLQVLYRVLQTGYDDIESQVAALYGAWFIETCAADIAPMIGELVGAQPTSGSPPATYRAEVANTLSWRARPGVLQTVAQAAASITGWPTAAIDLSAYLAASAAMSPAPGPTAGVRIPRRGTDGPGHPMTCAASFRRPTAGRAREGFDQYRNLNAVELQVWTLPVYAVDGAAPGQTGELFAFHPAGVESPLYISPQTFATASPDPGLCGLPRQLTRALLQEILASPTAEPPFAIRFRDNEEWVTIPSKNLRTARLEPQQAVPVAAGGLGVVLVDPERGLFAFSGMAQPEPGNLRVDYAYGFGGPVGGGPYRGEGRSAKPGDQLFRVASQVAAETPDGWRTSLQAAFDSWSRNSDLFIELVDSGLYGAPSELKLPPGRSVVITALAGVRPTLTGTLSFAEQMPGGATPHVVLDGLHCLGDIVCRGASLTVDDCTIGVEQPTAILLDPREAAARLRIERSVVGPVCSGAAWVDARRTIFDSRPSPGAAPSAALQGVAGGPCPSNVVLEHCTVFGDMSLTQPPRLTDCAIEGLLETPTERRRLRSPFMTRLWGDPYYLQLASDHPTRADDGVFGSDGRARRLHDLEAAIARHLPQGLSCTVVLAT